MDKWNSFLLPHIAAMNSLQNNNQVIIHCMQIIFSVSFRFHNYITLRNIVTHHYSLVFSASELVTQLIRQCRLQNAAKQVEKLDFRKRVTTKENARGPWGLDKIKNISKKPTLISGSVIEGVKRKGNGVDTVIVLDRSSAALGAQVRSLPQHTSKCPAAQRRHRHSGPPRQQRPDPGCGGGLDASSEMDTG